MKIHPLLPKIAIAAALLPLALFGTLALSAWHAQLTIPAQIVRLALPFIYSPQLTDLESYRAAIAANRTAGPALPWPELRNTLDFQQETIRGYPVWTAAPQLEQTTQLHILYIHGGGYVMDLLHAHWTIAADLIQRTDATLVMPLYPLAPEHDWQPAHEMVASVYGQLVQEVGAQNVVIIGDSAGGGFALSLAQQLRDQGADLPAALVLFSPWLDLTVSDPSQVALDRTDPILDATLLQHSGEWWAGDLSTTDPLISPLLGSMDGLPPIALFSGTADLLYPDAQRLAAKAQVAGTPLTFFKYPNEHHVWIATYPHRIPEAQRALNQAATFILAHTEFR